MKKKLITLTLLAFTQTAFATNLEYVGGNRYYCKGKNCEVFDRVQNSRDERRQTNTRRLNEHELEAVYTQGYADGKEAAKKGDK